MPDNDNHAITLDGETAGAQLDAITRAVRGGRVDLKTGEIREMGTPRQLEHPLFSDVPRAQHFYEVKETIVRMLTLGARDVSDAAERYEGRIVDAEAVIRLTEKQFQSQVVALARLLGWRVYHSWMSIRSAPGYPDLTLVRGGRLVFAELKAERGQLSLAQSEWLGALSATGKAEVYCWRPGDWDDVEATLR